MRKKLIALILLFFLFLPNIAAENKTTVYFFYSSTCPHCAEEKPFLKKLERKHPQLEVKYLEVGKNVELLKNMSQEYGTTTGGVPRTFVGNKVFIGFDKGHGDLVYHDGYKAYIGYKNQIELAIKRCLNVTCLMEEKGVIEISKNISLVKELLQKNPSSLATTSLVNGTFYVGWWTPTRIKSNLQYPNVLVKVDPETGQILQSSVPSQPVGELEKPIQGLKEYYMAIPLAILVYLLAYLFLRNRVSFEERYWLIGFVSLLLISGFFVSLTSSARALEKFASGFPFPVFVFILALLDGLNPCAFTVLAILLSLLTYTRSRKSMALVGSIFIITSGIMYFIFIMLILLAGSLIFSSYGILLFRIIGGILLIAGAINLKDFFW